MPKAARWTTWLGVAVLTVLPYLIYAGAEHGGFIWDDINAVVGSPLLRKPTALHDIWFTRQADDYWPVTYTLYYFEVMAFGTAPTPYHLVNTSLHALNGLLLWLVLMQLGLRQSFWAALLFLVHPVQVEAVAWIVQAKTLLSFFFCLLSLLALLRWQLRPRRWLYWASLGCFALAMLSKSAAAFWPFVLAGCLAAKRPLRGRVQGFLQALRTVAPFVVLGVTLTVVAIEHYDSVVVRPTAYMGGGETALRRLALAGWNLWFYLSKALLPINLNFVYKQWDLASPLAFLPSICALVLLLLMLLLLAVSWRRARGGWVFGTFLAAMYYGAALLPCLGLFYIQFMRYAPAADHYQYFALVAVAVLAAEGGAALARRQQVWPPWLAFLPVAGVLGWLSCERSRAYADAQTLWHDTLEKNPKAWLAHAELGNADRVAGNVAEAISHYEAVVRLQPANAEAHNVLGIMLLQQGKTAAALQEYERAVEADADSAAGHLNLGVALQMSGRLAAAVAHYRRAVALNPALAEAHSNLGQAYFAQGELPAALDEFRAAADLQGDSAENQYNYGAVLARLGDSRGAAAAFARAEALAPGYSQTRSAASDGTQIRASDASGEAVSPPR